MQEYLTLEPCMWKICQKLQLVAMKHADKDSRGRLNSGDEYRNRFQSQTCIPNKEDESVINVTSATLDNTQKIQPVVTLRCVGKTKVPLHVLQTRTVYWQLVSFMLRPPHPRYPQRHKGKQ